MTDRYNALIVVLEKDTRDDDAEKLIAAIEQLNGVLSVKGHIADPGSMIATARARAALIRQIREILV